MNIEEFKKETNSRFKFYRDEYIKKLEGVLPLRRRNSRKVDSIDLINNDINYKFKEFVEELFTKSNQMLIQSTSISQFCKQFGMDRDHLLNLKDFDEKQEYLLNCINQQIQNKTGVENNDPKLKKCTSLKKIQKSWMKMNTKHQYLQNKVRQAFMQALNQQGNQQKIDDFVKQHNERKKSKQHDDSRSPKLKLNKIPDNDPQKLQVLSINWDAKTEVKLKQKINQMKSELRDVSYSRKLGRQRYITKQQYMLVAYSQIMRTFNEHKQYNMDRDTILKKYLQRQIPLTENEMKFILNTSPLITKSLNKTKIKTAIQNLDPQYLHSIQIKIADQVLSDFNNSIKQIKKSRKVFKKQNLNNILNKLHQIQKSQTDLRQSHESDRAIKNSEQLIDNQRQHKNNLIHKYSGGYDSIKKMKEIVKTTETIHKANKSHNQSPRKKISNNQSLSRFQRPQTALNKTNRTNKSTMNNVSEATQKRKRQFLIKSLQISALRNNFQWVIVENYPHFAPHQVNVADKQGNTPLYYVTKTQNQQFCMYLLKCGANVNYVCQKGQTPLHMAFKSNNHNIISACLMKNPDLNVLCNKGLTPLAHGKIVTLKTFGLMNGVPKSNPNEPKFFDNNRLLVIPQNKGCQQTNQELIY